MDPASLLSAPTPSSRPPSAPKRNPGFGLFPTAKLLHKSRPSAKPQQVQAGSSSVFRSLLPTPSGLLTDPTDALRLPPKLGDSNEAAVRSCSSCPLREGGKGVSSFQVKKGLLLSTCQASHSLSPPKVHRHKQTPRPS